MYLKSIELTGFKSFAKKAELNFTSRVSAIVGPNGSGKSNIAEAFRFVLGEQSHDAQHARLLPTHSREVEILNCYQKSLSHSPCFHEASRLRR
jgi:DNA repair exonuclease SbcCD ATPase subunit